MEKKEKLNKIPQEPEAKEGVITFAFRIQDGSKIIRRFNKTDKIEVFFIFFLIFFSLFFVSLRLGSKLNLKHSLLNSI